ncbi:MAG: endolytic transglycosylase MltG [Actinobacteria bacterium]|nr:endolytic transglycosylase MltG [Actinomycetota bacterium]
MARPGLSPMTDLDHDRLTPEVRIASPNWRRWRRVIVSVGLGIGMIGLLWFGIDQLTYLRKVNPPGNPLAADVFRVVEGSDVGSLALDLETAGFIVDSSVFERYVGEKGGLEITPGYYTMRPRDHLGNLLRVLRTPPNETYFKMTFPEGFTVDQIAERVAGEMRSVDVEDFVTDAGLKGTASVVRSKYQPDTISSLEGLLFPDTYLISGDSTSAQILRDMISLMERVGRQEGLDDGDLGRSPYDVLIIASMIEREAKLDDDRDLIARVIYNRLEAGMPLEIDATLYYRQDPALPFADLKAIDSPYNTYLYLGLPPTPIANPGRKSIAAALDPAPNPSAGDPLCAQITEVDRCRYLYYVLADEDGRHVFAATLDQHLANVQAAIAAGVL